MRDFFKGIWFKILLGILAVLLGFLLYEASTGNISAPSQFFGIIAQPFTHAASWISDTVGGALDPVVHGSSYKKENEALRQQVADLQNQLVDYDSTKAQNQQLQEIAGIKQVNPDFDMQPAMVIARDSDDNDVMFTIDAGSMQGVEKNDPVITSAGLVGIVSNVAPTYAQVTTLLSPDLSISAHDSRTGASGIVCGNLKYAGQGLCEMKHLDKGNDITNGNLIVTSGASGLYPSDLVVGSVQELQIDQNGISSYAVILPAVDIQRVTEVTVIKSFEGQNS